jgi:phenylacetic acid degradation operon negative regulatory protein
MSKSLTRMTARSVVLSVLLGAHPAWASAAELIRLTSDFGIKEPTLRVALTRMVSAGDLIRSADGYRLADRLLARQRRQDDAMRPQLRPWRGYWTTVIVTSVGTDPRTRAALRTTLHDRRFRELREGVWMRPDNLCRELDGIIADQCEFFVSHHSDSSSLAASLWDLPGWAAEADRLLTMLDETESLAEGFMATAEIIRHLLLDPYLPDELLPAGWPGDRLRERYTDFNANYSERLRKYSGG